MRDLYICVIQIQTETYMYSGVNLVWNLGVVNSGKKIDFSRQISQEISIFQDKVLKNFDFFQAI